MGDVKMLAMIGAFLGWKLTLVTLMMASFAGSVVGVALIASRRGSMKYALPFGTFLALGAALAATVGTGILDWYLRLSDADDDARDIRSGLRAPRPDGDRRPRSVGVADVRHAARSFAAARDARRGTRAAAARRRSCRRRCRKRSRKLKAQERATAARADASERLSGEIIASLTAGLLVVGLNGEVRILNPAGRRHARACRMPRRSTTIDALPREPPLLGRHRRVPRRRRADRAPRRSRCRSATAAPRTSASPCRRSSTSRASCTAPSASSPI